jgi:hypothetical protein
MFESLESGKTTFEPGSRLPAVPPFSVFEGSMLQEGNQFILAGKSMARY